MMRSMLEFNISLLFAIFFIMAAGFVILTLPMGLILHLLSRQAWRCSDEAEPTVLFDAPGPKARALYRMIAVDRRRASCWGSSRW